MAEGARGSLVQAVRAHGAELACLDACGARLATGGGRALRLWRWERGAGWQPGPEARAAHRYGVTCVRWAGAGALLASAGVDGAVRLWAAGRGLHARRALAAPGAAAVRALCWAGAGGARLLAAHDDGELVAWAAARGELLARLRAHDAALHALCAPGAGALLLTACTHGVLKVWPLAAVLAGEAPPPLQWVDGAHDLGALCADASAGGAAATGGHDALVRVWRAEGAALEPAGALAGHTAAVTALRWALAPAAGEVLASVSLDRTARLWAGGACLLALAAHPRYLTAVALAPDLRYMVTGSNDKSFRTWSLGEFSLADDVESPCAVLQHFALGDLEGIGPVDEDEAGEEAAGGEEEDEGEGELEESEEGSGARRVWSEAAHGGAINCIACHGDLLATASSDGTVKLWRWEEAEARLVALHSLGEREYPALAVDFGAAGSVVVAGGLDGAALWDAASGVCVRQLVPPGGRGGEAGGGGVRGARLSPHRAPHALLATDDGLAPLWRLADPEPLPLHVYGGLAEAATCCCWSADGRLAAVGAAGGELRLLAPPDPAALHHDSQAHDLGVLSCDFAPAAAELELEEECYLLATGGCDALVKLWRVRLEGGGAARVQLALSVAAHGGAVGGVRWGRGALLATAGADRWARVWRVRAGPGGLAARAAAAVPVRGAGGAPAAALLPAGLLAVGTLAGELALWRLRGGGARDEDHTEPRYWGPRAAARWLRECAGGAAGGAPLAAELEARALAARITGARLLDDDIQLLLTELRLGSPPEEAGDEESAEDATPSVRGAVLEELQWLRMPEPPPALAGEAPHWLLCPLTHGLLRRPARAADGYSYCALALAEWVSAHGAVSPLTGRRLRQPAHDNLRLRRALRAFLRERGHAPPATTTTTTGQHSATDRDSD